MKFTSIFTATSLIVAVALPVFAQTAPATTPAAPATQAATPYANVAAVQQVNAQLTTQGYSVTNVTKAANGTYTITAISAAGVARTITVNPATGAVTDTVNGGMGTAAGDKMGNDRGNDNGNDTERGMDNGPSSEGGESGSNN